MLLFLLFLRVRHFTGGLLENPRENHVVMVQMKVSDVIFISGPLSHIFALLNSIMFLRMIYQQNCNRYTIQKKANIASFSLSVETLPVLQSGVSYIVTN